MGLPPELMAAIGGAGADPAAGGLPPGPADATANAPTDNLQFLQDAIDAAKQYVDVEDDEVHKQTALQCIAKLQSILADEQKGSDDLLQGKPNPRALRRAASGPAV
jgi:hypothetical protein